MLLLMVFMLFLTACGGSVKNVNKINVDFEKYTESEINVAINMAVKHFKDHFGGCTLTQIQYIGDDHAEEFKKWAEKYDAE